jgi:hypothetical protein
MFLVTGLLLVACPLVVDDMCVWRSICLVRGLENHRAGGCRAGHRTTAGCELDSDTLLLAGNWGSVHVPLAVVVDGARVEGKATVVK